MDKFSKIFPRLLIYRNGKSIIKFKNSIERMSLVKYIISYLAAYEKQRLFVLVKLKQRFWKLVLTGQVFRFLLDDPCKRIRKTSLESRIALIYLFDDFL